MTQHHVDATVRANLRALRRHAGLSQDRAAVRMGMTRSARGSYERDLPHAHSRAIATPTLPVLASGYGVTVHDLFDPLLPIRLTPGIDRRAVA